MGKTDKSVPNDRPANVKGLQKRPVRKVQLSDVEAFAKLFYAKHGKLMSRLANE